MYPFPNAPWHGAGANACISLRFFLPTLFALLLTSAANAETSHSALTLSSALERTLDNSPSLKLYVFRKEALQGAAYTANLRPGYEIELEAENFAGSGDTEAFDSAELTVSLSSVMELGDKRNARSGLVTNTRSMLDTQLRLESLAVLAEVTRRFVETLSTQARLELNKEALKLAEEAAKSVQKRVSAGAASAAEAKRAQSALAMARLMQSSAEQRFDTSKVSLAALWGESIPSFDSVEGDLFNFGTDISLEELYIALENNPAIAIYADEERVADAEIRLARSQSKADLGWSFGIRRIRETDDTALVAGLSMPLFSERRNAGEVSRLRAQKNSIAVEREADILKLRALLFSAYSARQQAIVTVEQLQTNVIPALEDALRQTRLGYQRGRFSYLEYISVAKELLESKMMLIETAAAVLTYGAEIEQLSASALTANPSTPIGQGPGEKQ